MDSEMRLRPRVPRDEFEAELMLRLIQAEIAKWRQKPGLEASVDRNHEDGVWILYVSNPGEAYDPMRILPYQMVVGSVWVAEREYPVSEVHRLEVEWSIGSQTNAGMPPVLDWDHPNPAGPWNEQGA